MNTDASVRTADRRLSDDRRKLKYFKVIKAWNAGENSVILTDDQDIRSPYLICVHPLVSVFICVTCDLSERPSAERARRGLNN